MSVKKGTRGYLPNWLKINWTAQERIKSIRIIMSLSPCDWSVSNSANGAETWAVWCLTCCETRNEAIESWFDFCDS
jgi:hypothetical protein